MARSNSNANFPFRGPKTLSNEFSFSIPASSVETGPIHAQPLYYDDAYELTTAAGNTHHNNVHMLQTLAVDGGVTTPSAHVDRLYKDVSGEIQVNDNMSFADTVGVLKVENIQPVTQRINLQGDVVITQDLAVQGTTTTINTQELSVKDRFIYINSGYLTNSAETVGFVMNIQALSSYSLAVGGNFVAGVVATSNATVNLDVAAIGVFSAGQFIQISGSTKNDGIYECLVNTGSTLTIRGIGVTNTVEVFSQRQFQSEATTGSMSASHVSLNILRFNAGTLEVGAGSSSGIVFTGVSSYVPYTITNKAMLYGQGTTVPLEIPTANNSLLATNGSGIPAWSSSIPLTVQQTISRLGTIDTGVWNGSTIATSFLDFTSVPSNNLMLGSGSATLTNVAPSANKVLATNGSSVPSWSASIPLAVQQTISRLGTIDTGVWNGSTIATSFLDFTSVPTNNLMLGSGSAALSNLPPSASSVLQTNGSSVPSYSQTLPSVVQGNITATGTVSLGTWHGDGILVPYGGTGLGAVAANALLYGSGGNILNVLASAANSILQTNGSSVPSYSQTLPSAVQGNITATGTVALGTWHGDGILVPYGGTGLGSVANNALVYGSGGNILNVLSPVADSTLTTDSSGVPSWTNITSNIKFFDDFPGVYGVNVSTTQANIISNGCWVINTLDANSLTNLLYQGDSGTSVSQHFGFGILQLTAQSNASLIGYGLSIPYYLSLQNGNITLEARVYLDSVSIDEFAFGAVTSAYTVNGTATSAGYHIHTAILIKPADDATNYELSEWEVGPASATKVSTATAFSTGWHVYKLVISTARVDYYIDGVQMSNPGYVYDTTKAFRPFIQLRKNSMSDVNTYIDYVRLSQAVSSR
jgi:hypothetical protein